MRGAPINLQDLRQRIYDTAKAETTKRFWGLYVHVAKLETLRAGYDLVKRNNGAPGIDGVTFEAIEAAVWTAFLAQTAGRTGHTHLSATAEPAGGDSEGRRDESPRPRDSGHP